MMQKRSYDECSKHELVLKEKKVRQANNKFQIWETERKHFYRL